MNDFSFLTLNPDFEKAKYTRASSMSSIFVLNQIILSPNETYLQTTNVSGGIAFDGNYQVKIVDCSGIELMDITNNVAINERTINGVPQIDFEIARIGRDFYNNKVYLKFIHTVGELIWYSNPIVITNLYKFDSSYFAYKNVGDQFYQSIRLHTFFSVNDAESNSSSYTSYDGKKVTSRLVITEMEKYLFEKIDNFTYRRLNNLLSRNVVYINGNRITDKQTISSSDRTADTNIFGIDFKVSINYNETFDYNYQIFDELQLINYAPKSSVSIIPLDLYGTYNYAISQNVGTIKLYEDGILISTFFPSDILISGNVFSIDISGLISVGHVYTVKLSDGLFSTIVGNSEAFEWQFDIQTGEYENTQYTNEYLIN